MASFNHYQPISSTNWIIPHKLNSQFLAIDIMKLIGNGSYEKIQAHIVEQVDDNTISVKFQTPVSGRARIVTK